MDSVKLS